MLEILLIGVIHDYQWDRSSDLSRCIQTEKLATYQKQRKFYREWIRAQVINFSPCLIFDELNSVRSNDPDDRLEDTGVLWVYMDIPESVRKEFGLSMGQRPPGCEWIKEIDEPREVYWQMVIEGICSACKVQKALVICGLAHLAQFVKRLRASGHEVSARNLRDESWIDETWGSGPAGKSKSQSRP